MPSQVRIQNFKCLRDVRLELGPLTVLVGPNASGKSAILQALTLDPDNQTRRWRMSDAPVTVTIDGHRWPREGDIAGTPGAERRPENRARSG